MLIGFYKRIITKRAKSIKNKPKINEDPKDALLRKKQEELEILKAQIRQMALGNNPNLIQEIPTTLTKIKKFSNNKKNTICLLYTSPSPRDLSTSRMPSSA